MALSKVQVFCDHRRCNAALVDVGPRSFLLRFKDCFVEGEFASPCSGLPLLKKVVLMPKGQGEAFFSDSSTPINWSLSGLSPEELMEKTTAISKFPYAFGNTPQPPRRTKASAASNPTLQNVIEKLDAIEQTVLPHARRGSNTIASASAGGKKRAEEFAPKYESAREFMRTYHKDNSYISFTEVRKKAADKVGVSVSALRKHIKKSDFPDW